MQFSRSKKTYPIQRIIRFAIVLAAISVGIVDGKPTLDLDYEGDYAASVDMNVVMTGRGKFVELQGTGEEDVFSEEETRIID